MSLKGNEEHPDDVADEMSATCREQTIDETANDDVDKAANRRELDRITRLIEVVTRSRDIGTPDCGLGKLATNAIDGLVAAACQRGVRIFESDSPGGF